MRLVLLVAALFSAAIAEAQNPAPVSLESLAAPLLKARTYCESGKWGVNFGPKAPLSETSYRVCASSDGRFKYVQNPGQPEQFVIWSDGQSLHRYVLYGGIYQTHDLAAPEAEYTYPRPREQVPALHSRLFRSATRSAAGLDLLGTLREYRINDGLSDGQRTVYEFVGDDKRSVSRIQVTAADGAITRLESWYDGNLQAFMQITSRELDRPLADTDLGQEVPLLTRYSYRNAPAVFIAGLFVITIVAGLAFWTWFFGRAEAFEDAVRLRSRLWRYCAWVFVLVASALVLLAVTTRGGSGHPPAIVYVMVAAIVAGIAFALAACFLLSSYAGQALAGLRRSR